MRKKQPIFYTINWKLKGTKSILLVRRLGAYHNKRQLGKLKTIFCCKRHEHYSSYPSLCRSISSTFLVNVTSNLFAVLKFAFEHNIPSSIHYISNIIEYQNINSEKQTSELTCFEFPEPDPELWDEIIEVSKHKILLFLLAANF